MIPEHTPFLSSAALVTSKRTNPTTHVSPCPLRSLRPHLHRQTRAHRSHRLMVEDVDVAGVGDVGEEVVHGAGAGGDGLGEAPEDGHHGQAPVGDLLLLQLLLPLGVLGVAHLVEEAGRVADVLVVPAVVVLEEGVLVHAAGVLHVVPAADLSPVHHGKHDPGELALAGPVLVRVGAHPVGQVAHARAGQQLGHRHARHAQHRPAAVHQLGLHEPLQVLGVGAEAEGVEAVVAGEGAVEVGGGRAPGHPHGAGGSLHSGHGTDADGGAGLDRDATGADGQGAGGEPGGELSDGGHLASCVVGVESWVGAGI
mmetsp:Transcript_18677/g.46492  ORF Transcript_18677/g.46492 Transcript_18677/m.46492 type:complete len:311 (+) Transcript_18677:131-1063(+)